MHQKAIFSGIQSNLAGLIDSSKESLDICVAWFTSEELFGCLNEAFNKGIRIRLIISDDRSNEKRNFHGLNRNNGEVRITTSNRFLHEKFALFDGNKLVHGTYNWTYSAEFRNHESVIITDDPILIKQFEIRFKNIWMAGDEYLKRKLVGHSSTGFEQVESALQSLEEELEKELKESIEFVVSKKVPINRIIIEEILVRYGAIGACRRLANDTKIQPGFQKVWEHGLIDYTLEAIMVKEKYSALFTDEDRLNARNKLKMFKK